MPNISEITLKDSDGASVQISDLWRDQPVAFVFMRHYGCIFCREQAIRLNQARGELAKAGGKVVVVGMGTPEHAAHFKSESGIELPLLVDNDRTLYNKLGMKRGNWIEVVGPGNMLKGFSAWRKGARQKAPKQDPKQLGGAAVIDTSGSVTWSHVSMNSGDTVAADTIIDELKKAGAAITAPASGRS